MLQSVNSLSMNRTSSSSSSSASASARGNMSMSMSMSMSKNENNHANHEKEEEEGEEEEIIGKSHHRSSSLNSNVTSSLNASDNGAVGGNGSTSGESVWNFCYDALMYSPMPAPSQSQSQQSQQSQSHSHSRGLIGNTFAHTHQNCETICNPKSSPDAFLPTTALLTPQLKAQPQPQPQPQSYTHAHAQGNAHLHRQRQRQQQQQQHFLNSEQQHKARSTQKKCASAASASSYSSRSLLPMPTSNSSYAAFTPGSCGLTPLIQKTGLTMDYGDLMSSSLKQDELNLEEWESHQQQASSHSLKQPSPQSMSMYDITYDMPAMTLSSTRNTPYGSPNQVNPQQEQMTHHHHHHQKQQQQQQYQVESTMPTKQHASTQKIYRNASTFIDAELSFLDDMPLFDSDETQSNDGSNHNGTGARIGSVNVVTSSPDLQQSQQGAKINNSNSKCSVQDKATNWAGGKYNSDIDNPCACAGAGTGTGANDRETGDDGGADDAEECDTEAELENEEDFDFFQTDNLMLDALLNSPTGPESNTTAAVAKATAMGTTATTPTTKTSHSAPQQVGGKQSQGVEGSMMRQSSVGRKSSQLKRKHSNDDSGSSLQSSNEKDEKEEQEESTREEASSKFVKCSFSTSKVRFDNSIRNTAPASKNNKSKLTHPMTSTSISTASSSSSSSSSSCLRKRSRTTTKPTSSHLPVITFNDSKRIIQSYAKANQNNFESQQDACDLLLAVMTHDSRSGIPLSPGCSELLESANTLARSENPPQDLLDRVSSEDLSGMKEQTTTSSYPQSQVCRFCERKFADKTVLQTHQETHVKAENVFVCLETGCSREYNTAEGLRLHMRNRHSGRKPWICLSPGCDRRYVRQSDLRMHVIRSHSTIRPFPCRVCSCSKAFACYSELRRHVWSSHTEIAESLAESVRAGFEVGAQAFADALNDVTATGEEECASTEDYPPEQGNAAVKRTRAGNA